jgi:tyrosine-protein phosphatase YwqE
MNKVNGIQLMPGDPGYHEFKPYLRTITTNDVYTVGNLANSDKPYAKSYARNNETDASSRLSPTAYREIKKRNGQWSDEAEAFHQWQMAWTRQNWPNYKYTNRELEAHDIELVKKPSPNYVIDVLKPIVSGTKYGKDYIDNVIDKFSQVPVYYSMVKGKISEEHYIRMFEDKVDYEVVISGRKMGAEDVRELYNGDGTYNNSEIDKSTFIDIPWAAYGIQQENSYDREKLQTRGSQLNKLATVDLFSNGVPIGATPERQEVIRKAVDRNNTALSNLVDQGYKNLLNKLGIEDLGNNFKLVDKSAVADILRQSMLSQQMSINALDSVTLVDGEFKIPFEASTNYVQIKNLLYSIVNKSIVSPKMNGFSGVQMSSAMMEEASVGRTLLQKYKTIVDGKEVTKWKEISKEEYNALSPKEQKDIMFGAKDLKFYEDEDGKRYCEIYLPNYLSKYFPGKTEAEVLQLINDSPDGQKILMGIGFRIPTQALSSVEVFKVKGFLPAYMGRSVVVPSEITTKAGSDFDIDKLNMYLRSVYKDADGDIRLIQLRGSEEETKNYFRKIFDDTIEQEIERLSKYDNFRDVLVGFFSKLEALQQLEGQVDLSNLSEDDQRFYAIHESILTNIMDQASENGVMPSDYVKAQIETIGDVKDELFAKILASKTRSQYVESMYGKALENEFYDSLEELLTLPENFDRLVNPNTDKSLKDLAAKIDKLEGVNESSVVNPLLNRSYMSGLRHAFTLAKKWVGVAAVNITGNSLYQKTQVYVKNSATSLLFPHNTIEINGQEHISLSGMLNTLGQYISDKLSEYANGFVDVAKDPYILKIIYSDRIVGSFMFLERAGVPTDTIGYFMNQPIIKNHINFLDTTKKSIYSISNKNNVNYTKKAFKTSRANLDKAKLILAEYKESGNVEKLNKLLEDGIENKAKLSSIENAIQHLLLEEFLKIVDLASANFKVSQAVNYDTTNFRSSEEFDRKNQIRDAAKEENLIAGIDGILDSSFISPIINALENSTKALGEILVFNRDEFRQVLKDTLKYYSNSQFISAYKFRKIAEKATASFLDYLIYTKGPILDMQELLVDKDSVADRVLKYKESRKDLKILEKLSVVFRENVEDSVKTVKLNSKLNNAFDENALTGYMREMRNDTDPKVRELYNDLIKVIITQGSVMSSSSLKRIVPLEDYADIIAPIMKNLVYDEDIANFARSNWFQKNMYFDRDVAVTHTPKFDAGMIVTDPESGESTTVAVPKEDYYDEVEPAEYPFMGDDDTIVKVYHMSTVVVNEKLGATYDNKKLLRVSARSKGEGSPIIVIPRIIPAPYGIDDAIDFESGHTVPNKKYAVLESEIGDAINMMYGYELVTDDDQNPVYDYDSKGNAFLLYKAVNLFGDPGLVVEYGLFKEKSSFNNNTKVVDQPLSNTAIVNEYSDSKFKKEGEARDYGTDALSEDLKC